jgi:hypothetical protein
LPEDSNLWEDFWGWTVKRRRIGAGEAIFKLSAHQHFSAGFFRNSIEILRNVFVGPDEDLPSHPACMHLNHSALEPFAYAWTVDPLRWRRFHPAPGSEIADRPAFILRHQAGFPQRFLTPLRT